MDSPSLFGFIRPRSNEVKKILTKERVEEMKKLWAAGKKKDAIEALREIRYKLESLERRIKSRPE